ncbi:aarF domain-containing kinase 1 [Sitodiplosis mosellana]|uniref:aarF domain-containing kinase 1 n=1 Tax=Sitodiplosis mosellana TaxID=263140 RepID=UPI002444365E|nr:aarF domain-containing kinase 1 [Sitodiplosis mosellana]XP_055317648.1 aarF domain-containing kinase 1 [Sitodiplosis mosellana]XP_055317649.1 aarF domain-containing kinase 1 [Sitodiplosis mosellana]XP_055317650.1 aarF domain-containing kinase 1 [Sitodiplosis mosellana]
MNRAWPLRRVLKYSAIGGSVVLTGLSLRTNDYDVNSVGIIRLSRAALTVYDIACLYRNNLYKKEWDKKSAEYKAEKSRSHTLAAEKLLKLICINKGVYIKVGQHIGSLDYLLPAEFVSTMKVLHSNAPKNPIEDLYKVIRQDLKVNPEELFESFDAEPLGTASLAQVHRATLKNGQEVAVKVQHPYVLGNSNVDMKTMEYLCKIMSIVFPDFKMQWLVDESKKNLPIELDFLNEGRNAEKVADMFKDYKWLKVPKIFWDISTKRVLVMEYVTGGQVNDLEYIHKNKIDTFDVANKIGQLYSNMIFINGFVHSDPHPGNILVRKTKKGDNEIILLDHGLYANLTDEFRYQYSKLWLSILNVDRKGMRFHTGKLGIKGDLYPLFACMLTGRPWESVIAGIDRIKPNAAEKELVQSNSTLVLPSISDILEQVDRQMLLILKTNDLIRGIETTLQTQYRMTSFWVMSKCCIESVARQEIHHSKTYWQRFAKNFHKNWTIFKLNIYYLYLGIINFNLFSTLRQLV